MRATVLALPEPMERVLVVPTDLILGCLGTALPGFYPGLEERCLAIVDAVGRFVERAPAEEDPGLKQVIPYGVLCWRDQVLLLRRSRRGGDVRLQSRSSLGVGGHVNPVDAEGGGPLRSAVARAFERELHEELCVDAPYAAAPIGLLNDDTNSVGQVHIGVVYRVELSSPQVSVREAERLAGSLVEPVIVHEQRSSLETWSSLLAGHLWPDLFRLPVS